MGRVPEKPAGRYGYTREESQPPQGLHRRSRPDIEHPLPSEPPRAPAVSDPPLLVKVGRETKKKAIAKVAEYVAGFVVVAICTQLLSGIDWLTTRASKPDLQVVGSVCLAASSWHEKRENELAEAIAQERAARVDAGGSIGEALNRQDGINKHVWEITRRRRDETPPPPVGPKAQQEGRL